MNARAKPTPVGAIRLPETMEMDTDANLHDPEVFTVYRSQLRDRLLAETLMGSKDALTIELSFSGLGDSGNWEDQHDDTHVMRLFNHLLEHHVTVDWYNNDGGGGKIIWDIQADVITIDSYYNETVQNDQPTRTFGPGSANPEEKEGTA